MTGMEHAIEHAARAMWRYDNPDLHPAWVERSWGDAGESGERAEYELRARALADAGLLAPAPLREEWCAAYYGVYADGTRTLHTIGTEGSREHAEETRADCAQDDPETRFFVARSYYTPWLPVDPAEGDGRADQ